MNKNQVAVVVLLACAAAARAADETAGCEYHEEASSSATPVTQNHVTLLGMTPPEGDEVRGTTVIGIDVDYQITNFAPDQYYLVGMFPTAGSGAMNTRNRDDKDFLRAASGKAHFCVPLREVYEHPTMRWPLTMWVMVMKMKSENSSVSVTQSRVVHLKATDLPERALKAQAQELPEEYQDALNRLFSYFGSRAGRYKACLARFPAMQPAFTKGYRAWESKHRAQIDLVYEAQFESYKAQVGDRTDVAANLDEAATGIFTDAFMKFPDAELKQQCQLGLEEVTDPIDNTNDAIGDRLAILRKYSHKTAENSK